MMMSIVKNAALVLMICLVAGSCADISTEEAEFGPLALDTTALTNAIPAGYGDLISVTTTEIYPGWAQLWFQKPDKTIVAVYLNYKNGRIRENALLIPRS